MSYLTASTQRSHYTHEHFRRAQKRALWGVMIGKLLGRPVNLLCLDDLPSPTVPGRPRERQDIPLRAVIGSVGRCQDFTPDFLPKRSSDEERWIRVLQQLNGLEGLPPIEVTQVGEVYFVADGHHRVSVARYLGVSTIEAFVTELKPLTFAPANHDDRTRHQESGAIHHA